MHPLQPYFGIWLALTILITCLGLGLRLLASLFHGDDEEKIRASRMIVFSWAWPIGLGALFLYIIYEALFKKTRSSSFAKASPRRF